MLPDGQRGYRLREIHSVVCAGNTTWLRPWPRLQNCSISEIIHALYRGGPTSAISSSTFGGKVLQFSNGWKHNIKQEVVAVLSRKIDHAAEEIRSYTRFFSVAAPKRADARGLVKCLSQSLSPLGIEDILDQDNLLRAAEVKPVMVGGRTDGASLNVAQQNGMRGMMQEAHPWLVWAWCYAHRLE